MESMTLSEYGRTLVGTRKAILEVAKLQDEQRERDFSIRASREDISG